MKIQKLLELRRNPEMNPKVSIFSALKKFQGECKPLPGISKGGEPVSNGFISFTNLIKLGINPKSSFDTPNAIYAYDIDYVIEMLQGGKYLPKDSDIPYAADKPYIHTFVVKEPERLYVVGRQADEDKLEAYIKENKPELFKYAYESDDIGATAARNARFNAKARNPNFAGEMGAQFAIIGDFFSSITKWSHFMREAGFDGVIDLGYKVIHHHEPRQTMVFSRSGIDRIAMEINTAQIMSDHPDAKRSLHTIRGTKSYPQFLNKTLNVSLLANPEELEAAVVNVGHSSGGKSAAVVKRLVYEITDQFSRSLNVYSSRKLRIIKTAINLCKVLQKQIPAILEKIYPADPNDKTDVELETSLRTIQIKTTSMIELMTNHLETTKNIIALKNDVKVATLMHSAYTMATAGKKDTVEMGRIFHQLETHFGKFVDYEVATQITSHLQHMIEMVGHGEDEDFSRWYSWVIKEADGGYDAAVFRELTAIRNSSD